MARQRKRTSGASSTIQTRGNMPGLDINMTTTRDNAQLQRQIAKGANNAARNRTQTARTATERAAGVKSNATIRNNTNRSMEGYSAGLTTEGYERVDNYKEFIQRARNNEQVQYVSKTGNAILLSDSVKKG